VPLALLLIEVIVALITLLLNQLSRNDNPEMERNGKRTIQINVRVSAEDFTLIQRAANALWPDAVLTNSGILLGLAKIAARDILKTKGGKSSK
jgi:hypothetical protein